MSKTFQDYLLEFIQNVFKQYPGAWLVWCDLCGDWLPLLQRVNSATGKKHFTLRNIDERTAGAFGSPLARKRLQEWLEQGEPFVLRVATGKDDLGWLYAQALHAEVIQDRTLRQVLRDWGWKPQNINTGDDEVARLARKNLRLPLGEWGGGQIMPEPDRLLEVLAGGPLPWQQQAPIQTEHTGEESLDTLDSQDARVVLELTVEDTGLPPINEQNLERWRLEALAHLLVTQAHRATPQHFAGHDYLINDARRPSALKLLDRWLDSVRLSQGLPDRIINADRILSLGSYFAGAELSTATYLSQALERALFATICASLTALSGRALLEALAPLTALFEKHARGFWGDQGSNARHLHSLPWGELARLSRAVKSMLSAAPQRPWASYSQAVEWYCKQGWKVEQAGEEIMRQLNKPTPELLTFITPLRQAYAHHWENYLIQWSDLWSQASCPPPAYKSQGMWLKSQLKDARSTAVIMLDALRYDIGMALSQRVNEREGGVERARVFPACTAIPSVTALGMGMALPIDEEELVAEVVNGKWQLYQQGQNLNLSIAENRREWLRTHLKVAPDALLSMDHKGVAHIPRAPEKHGRLYIFDDAIDKLGHDEELEPFGTKDVQERYIQAIEQLRDKGWMRVLIVTDHGFIHWPDMREQRVPLPLYDPAYTSRRALAYPASAQWKGPQVLAPGGRWRIAVPSGAECFRSYGGLGYFHGGASLQEWIVPCIEIKWPASARPIEIRIQPLAQILSLRPKITLEVQLESLFGGGNELPRSVIIIVRDQQQKAIFHSQPTLVTPNQHQVAVMLEPREEVEAARNTPMLIELRNAHTNEVIDTQPTTLMVEIENW